MTFKKTYNVDKDNQLIIDLPESFRSKKKVSVTIEDIDENREIKIALLKTASNDPLYLADIAGIEADFDYSNTEPK